MIAKLMYCMLALSYLKDQKDATLSYLALVCPSATPLDRMRADNEFGNLFLMMFSSSLT